MVNQLTVADGFSFFVIFDDLKDGPTDSRPSSTCIDVNIGFNIESWPDRIKGNNRDCQLMFLIGIGAPFSNEEYRLS